LRSIVAGQRGNALVLRDDRGLQAPHRRGLCLEVLRFLNRFLCLLAGGDRAEETLGDEALVRLSALLGDA
jgi:hypothetical protein